MGGVAPTRDAQSDPVTVAASPAADTVCPWLATSWLRALGVTTEYDDYHYFLSSLGREVEPLASALFLQLLKRLPIGGTRRYGKKRFRLPRGPRIARVGKRRK